MLDAILRRLMRQANSRALSGDYMAWFWVAGAAWFFLRARRRPPGQVFSVRMNPGDRMVVAVRDQVPGEDRSGSG